MMKIGFTLYAISLFVLVTFAQNKNDQHLLFTQILNDYVHSGLVDYTKLKDDKNFQEELDWNLTHYAGRPTPLYFAENLTGHYKRAKIYLKREDLSHTGAHKINNAIGQILLAKYMGKKRIIAETGAGQHGVATATVAARAGLECCVYMGEEDIERQYPNVQRMRMLGAEVRPVYSGTRTLKDATNEAMRDWLQNAEHTHYIIGSVVGPHPFPMIVRDFQKVIGEETMQQLTKMENKLPDYLIACVGGGSNAIGLFYPFLNSEQVKMVGVEAAGKGIPTGEHAATLLLGEIGIFHGMRTYLLQDENGYVQYRVENAISKKEAGGILKSIFGKQTRKLSIVNEYTGQQTTDYVVQSIHLNNLDAGEYDFEIIVYDDIAKEETRRATKILLLDHVTN